MSNYVNDTAAGKSISAYIILDKRNKHIATVRAHFSNAGVCLVNVFDDKAGFQFARASGYGYDKFTKALSNLSIDGHELSDHCGMSKTPPRGKKLFPTDYKAPKGFRLANYSEISAETGQRMNERDFDQASREYWGFASDESLNDHEHKLHAQTRRDLFLKWRKSDDCLRGYVSCFREAGLDYLKAIGYKVIQAI